jgi:hypothetical protein
LLLAATLVFWNHVALPALAGAEFIRGEHRLHQSFRTPSIATCPRIPLSLLMALSLVVGCGADERTIESSASYEPPIAHRIVVETVVDLPSDQAWDELIRRLSESSFRVATLEKASRFVSIELESSSDLATSANRPRRYVDCGRTTRILSVNGEIERFAYEVADSSRHRESIVVPDGFRVSEVDRRVELESRSTLYLQPEGKRRTRITVKARYEVRIEVSGSAVHLPTDLDEENGAPEAFGPRVESIRFSSFRPGQDQRRGGLTCRATGDLEHSLIALANPAAAI